MQEQQQVTKDEQEIIDMFEEIKTIKDPGERVVMFNLIKEKLKIMKLSGKSFSKVGDFFRERAEKAKVKMVEVGQQIKKCCGE